MTWCCLQYEMYKHQHVWAAGLNEIFQLFKIPNCEWIVTGNICYSTDYMFLKYKIVNNVIFGQYCTSQWYWPILKKKQAQEERNGKVAREHGVGDMAAMAQTLYAHLLHKHNIHSK